MPELPDVELYLHCLRTRIVGEMIVSVRIAGPSILRTYEPPIDAVEGRVVLDVRRLGKRIVFALDDDLFVVIHLMIAGRLRWYPADSKTPTRLAIGHAAFVFEPGVLWLTEAGTKKRASIHLERGEMALAGHDRGGLEIHGIDEATFAARLRTENHTLKRALVDPRLFSGIGNAYSDEILHLARLSPLALTARLDDEGVTRLFAATQATLAEWTDRLRTQFADRFPGPGDVTAFRAEMAVHGRFGKPCPVCDAPVQRIIYADNETNYCATCQTGGRVLADRSMSRLLGKDWPRTIEGLEEE